MENNNASHEVLTSNSWEPLTSQEEWEQYKLFLSDLWGVSAHSIIWGSGPDEYPCLVSSIFVKPDHVYSAFVYREHALNLLKICSQGMLALPFTQGSSASQEQIEVFPINPTQSNDIKSVFRGISPQMPMPIQQLINKIKSIAQQVITERPNVIAAIIATIVHFMIETGLCSEEKFVKLCTNFLYPENTTEDDSYVNNLAKKIYEAIYTFDISPVDGIQKAKELFKKDTYDNE